MLGSLGGRDIKHVTWSILARIFADSVATQINWKGVNNKKKFSEMATKALLARKCELYTYCSSKCQMSSANLTLMCSEVVITEKISPDGNGTPIHMHCLFSI